MQTACRRAFTLVELIVAVAIVGILVGLLLVSVQKVRDCATTIKCRNNLKQIGVALYMYSDDFNEFPAAAINPGTLLDREESYYVGQPYKTYNHSGMTTLLPYLEHDDLHRQYDYRVPACYAGVNSMEWPGGVNISGNEQVVSTRVPVYECPADGVPELSVVPGNTVISHTAMQSSYVFNTSLPGNSDPGSRTYAWARNMAYTSGATFTIAIAGSQEKGIFGPMGVNGSCRWTDMRDGGSNTIMVGESKRATVELAPFKTNPIIPGSGPKWGVATKYSTLGGVPLGVNHQDTNYYCPNYNYAKWWYERSNHPQDFVGPGDKYWGYQIRLIYGSWHQKHTNMVFGDGSVRPIHDSINWRTYRCMLFIGDCATFAD